MIRMQSSGGIDSRILPVFVCDVCKKPIRNIRDGMAVIRSFGLGEDELYDVLHVHKSTCNSDAVRQSGAQESGPWFELVHHLNDLTIGMGVTIRDFINNEIGSAGMLTPSQSQELEASITELGEWLRDHSIESPFFN